MTALAIKRPTRFFGRESNGILMTPEEFDRAAFDENYRYELINGVLVVSPVASVREADPNEELGHLLRTYEETHPDGDALDATLPERIVRTKRNRRRADRLIWAGLGRLPRRNETPTIIAEFVSPRKRDRERDYQTERREYMAIRVKEYWVFDRFARTMTVFFRVGGRTRKRVLREHQTYRTDLLPGFELPLSRLLPSPTAGRMTTTIRRAGWAAAQSALPAISP
jgi:Uma2 family endonuclease